MPTAFSPDIPSERLSFLTCTGPYAAIDLACIKGSTAGLRAGDLVGYVGWCLGEYPELLAAVNGELFAVPSAQDGRTPSRRHDPLMWLTAFCSNNQALYDAIYSAVRANMRLNMPIVPGTFEFAHKGTEPGWRFRHDSGDTGHWAHVEDALYLYRSTGDLYAREVWLNWLKAKRNFTPDYNRDTHTHFVRCWLTWLHSTTSSDPWFKNKAVELAKFLTARPLADHAMALYHPLWPYYIWQCMSDPKVDDQAGTLKAIAEKWIVDAADQLTTAGLARLTVSAVAYWITKDATYLTRELQELVDWSYGYYRSTSMSMLQYDWLGMQPGRTGCKYVPNMWPIFRAALVAAGSPPLPSAPGVNTIPLQRVTNAATGKLAGGTVTVLGNSLRKGLCRYRSGPFGGDTNGGIVYRYVNGKQAGSPERGDLQPYASDRGEFEYEFTDPTNELLAQAYQQVLGPLTPDPAERYKLTAGVKYDMGMARGSLETFGNVKIEPRVGPVTFYGQNGKPWNSFWAGLNPGFNLIGDSSIDARCHPTSAWTMTLSQPGIWRPAR